MKRPTHSDKRRQIIASTIKLLRKTGFEKVSVRAICQNADISIGTFYHYFRDKDDLLHAMLGGIDEYLLNEIQPRLASDSQLENLRTFALSFADSTVSTGSVYGSIISSTNVPLPASPDTGGSSQKWSAERATRRVEVAPHAPRAPSAL